MHDYTGAREAAERAKMWCFIALVGGVIAAVIGFIVGLAGALG